MILSRQTKALSAYKFLLHVLTYQHYVPFTCLSHFFQPLPFLHKMFLLESQETLAQCFLAPDSLNNHRSLNVIPVAYTLISLFYTCTVTAWELTRVRIPNHNYLCFINMGAKLDKSEISALVLLWNIKTPIADIDLHWSTYVFISLNVKCIEKTLGYA